MLRVDAMAAIGIAALGLGAVPIGPNPRRLAGSVVVVLIVSVGACGASPKTYVSAGEQRALPTRQLSASSELCPGRGQPKEIRLALKRQGHQHADALIRAFHRHPDALVHTSYASSDEGPGTADLPVRTLLEQWVRLSYCAPNVQSRLKAALGAQS